ncbi:TIGR00730 family Rossman fold protein [Hyphomicrobiales bacterium 4NK60-0047b]
MTKTIQKSILNTKPLQSICIFCGSGEGQNPEFKIATKTLGHLIAQNNIELIYGGGDMGLMGTIATAVKEKNGKVTGIIPEFLLKYQNENSETNGLIVTKDMHTRKAKMYELADAFIALPGGIGTLEELVETMTWAQLGTHQKPIALLNTANFWEPFLSLIDHMKSENFIREGLEVNFQVVNQPEDIINELVTQKNAHTKEKA